MRRCDSALYYPAIDIHDEEWLKTALLFWDELNTIVPASIISPYNTNSTRFLFDNGYLKPLKVDPDNEIIEDLTNDVLNYLNTDEGYNILNNANGNIKIGELNGDIYNMYELYPDKLPREIQYQLRSYLTDKGLFRVNSSFAFYYMTLLANKLCEINAFALLTDNASSALLTDRVRLGNNRKINREDKKTTKTAPLAQGLLTNMIIKGIKVLNETPFEDIIKFKQKYSDELGMFRTSLANLSQSIDNDILLEDIQKQVEIIYKDEFLPSFHNLKKALNGLRIKWIIDTTMKISFFSAAATVATRYFFGLSIPQALFVGSGASLTASIVNYNQEKEAMVRNNPFSYLLTINKTF